MLGWLDFSRMRALPEFRRWKGVILNTHCGKLDLNRAIIRIHDLWNSNSTQINF